MIGAAAPYPLSEVAAQQPCSFVRATRRSRTGDLLITNPDQGETPPHQKGLVTRKIDDPD
jgi:hypothetical protein